MQTSTPQFVHVCQLLVLAMEDAAKGGGQVERESILDALMGNLMREGIVFDRAYAGLIFDQLQGDPDRLTEGGLSPARLEELRERVRSQDYVTEAMLQSMGDRILWVLGSS